MSRYGNNFGTLGIKDNTSTRVKVEVGRPGKAGPTKENLITEGQTVKPTNKNSIPSAPGESHVSENAKETAVCALSNANACQSMSMQCSNSETGYPKLQG